MFLPRCFAAALCALGLAGCAGRPGTEVLTPVGSSVDGAKIVSVYVATTRARDAAETLVFTNRRSQALNFARYRISIPPGHKSPEIEWPSGGAVNPAAHFAILDASALSEVEFRAAVSSGPLSARGKRLAGVFVHGFNNSFPESLFRLAQLVGDSGYNGSPILFSWPSEGAASGYVADKEAATFSRDSLAQLLTALAEMRGVGEVGLIGHSMGAWLTAEALRQLRLTGQDRVIARLHPVVLAAPDIDVDVFRSQMAVIGRLDPPLTMLVSKDDRALSISAWLASTKGRLGNIDINDPRVRNAAAANNIQVIDISSVSDADPLGHNRFLGSTDLIRQIARGGADAPRAGPVRRAGVFVLDSVGALINP